MNERWEDWEQSRGVIVARQGKRKAKVRLADGRELFASWPRCLGDLAENRLHCQVKIAFRPNRSLLPMVVAVEGNGFSVKGAEECLG
jgi:hypothetical protein